MGMFDIRLHAMLQKNNHQYVRRVRKELCETKPKPDGFLFFLRLIPIYDFRHSDVFPELTSSNDVC